MPKRSSKSRPRFAGVVFLGVLALLVFGAGEAFKLTRTDAGQIETARYLHVGDGARVTQLVGRHIRMALQTAGVPADSIRESVSPDGDGPRVHWAVGLRPRASTLQVNYALTRELETQGAEILTGREEPGRAGSLVVTLIAGLPGRPLHEIVLTKPGSGTTPSQALGQLAVVLFGLGDDPERAIERLPAGPPIALAIPAGAPGSGAAFRAAHARGHEVVLHLPLEPLDYPRVSPGPGAILVTMSGSKIRGTLRHYLETAEPVTAVANLMGSMATQDPGVMTAIYDELHRADLPFLEMDPEAGSLSRSLAQRQGVRYAAPDVVIDWETRRHDAHALDRRWQQVLDLVRRRGRAVVMLRATDRSLAWLPGALAARKLGSIEIVPLATLMRRDSGA